MRQIFLPSAVIWCAGCSFAWAQALPATPAERAERREERREAADVVPRAADAPADATRPRLQPAPDTIAAPGAVREDWRYRHHNGHWWYWMPNRTWRVWSDNAWVVPGSAAAQSRYATGYRGTETSGANPTVKTDGYDAAHDSYNTYRRRALLRNRPRVVTPAPPVSPVAPPVQGSAIQGGGGQATGGPVGSPQEAGSIHIGGGSSSQSSGARARGNLGTFGTAGGQIGGSSLRSEAVDQEPVRVKP